MLCTVAQTLSDVRLSPAMYPAGSTSGHVLFMNNTTTAHAAKDAEGAPEAVLSPILPSGLILPRQYTRGLDTRSLAQHMGLFGTKTR